jgi:hypothetical protein
MTFSPLAGEIDALASRAKFELSSEALPTPTGVSNVPLWQSCPIWVNTPASRTTRSRAEEPDLRRPGVNAEGCQVSAERRLGERFSLALAVTQREC